MRKYIHKLQPTTYVLLRVLFIMSMTVFSACSQRELCYDHPHSVSVNIEFDWSEATDATPSTMVVYFFPVDNSQYTRFELTNEGYDTGNGFNSTIKVATGTYRVVCHNGDTNNNLEKGEIFSEYQITTTDEDLLAPLKRSDEAPRPETTENQPVHAQASTLYSYTHPETIKLKPNQDHTIVMKPRKSSAVITVTIDSVENIVTGMEFSGIISGLAESWYPSTGMPGGVEVTVPLRLTPEGTDCLRGRMEVLGDNIAHNIGHKFRLYTSWNYYFDFDITDQIHSAPDPYNIDITLSGVALPEAGSGMNVSVGEWEPAEIINISM